MTCRHQRLFIRQGNVFSCLDGFNGRKDTDHSHNGSHQNIRLRQGCDLDETVHSGHDADIDILQPFLQFFCCSFTEDSDDRGMKFSGLFFQKLHISVGRKCFHLYVTIMFHNFQRLGPDRTGRA